MFEMTKKEIMAMMSDVRNEIIDELNSISLEFDAEEVTSLAFNKMREAMESGDFSRWGLDTSFYSPSALALHKVVMHTKMKDWMMSATIDAVCMRRV